MGCVLGDSAPWAFVIILEFPFDQGFTYSTFGGGVLSYPPPASRLQGLHANGTGGPVDGSSGFEGKALVPDPVELGDGILDGTI